jgi:outer membrane putative beta-barrel porin/alpha-amylase
MLSSCLLTFLPVTDPVAAPATSELPPRHAAIPPVRFVPPSAPPYNHGPGTSGGGNTTTSGETLRAGRWSLELSSDWTEFESTSVAEAEAAAISAGEFDALGSAWVNQVELSYGLTDDLQLGVRLGYYAGSDFIDAEEDGLGGAESATADPSGMTDTWVTAKWRFHRGASGHLALVTGVKLPTGKDDETLSNGEELEPSGQPGSGAYDYQAGLGFSRFLTPRVTLDASGIYTIRSAHDGFEVGDRADLGLAVAYRLNEDVKAPNNWSLFGELNGVWLDEDVERGTANENSGGETVWLTLGARDRISEHVAFSLAPALPILQDVNGEQVETEWRVGATLTFSP